MCHIRDAPFFFVDYKNRLIFLSCDILRISLIYVFATSKYSYCKLIKQSNQSIHTFFSHFCTHFFILKATAKKAKPIEVFVCLALILCFCDETNQYRRFCLYFGDYKFFHLLCLNYIYVLLAATNIIIFAEILQKSFHLIQKRYPYSQPACRTHVSLITDISRQCSPLNLP